jgi:hypothetical protein
MNKFRGFCVHFFGVGLQIPGPWDMDRGIEDFFHNEEVRIYVSLPVTPTSLCSLMRYFGSL